MQTMLDAALSWAARGFRVFPLQANSKLPLGFTNWSQDATTDEARIRTWWHDSVTGMSRDYNVGVLTTGMVVVDVDTKPGKDGLATFSALGLEFDTLTIRTPSGGYHLYYSGADAGQSPLGKDVDIRSHNGYVLAPGSTIDGVPYTVEIEDAIAPLPGNIRPLLKAPKEKRIDVSVAVEADTPVACEMALDYLHNAAPLAVEGINGDDTTFKVACKLRDFGLSEATAFALLAQHWNPRCMPPWDAEELQGKVGNAFNYAKGVAGSLHPEAIYGDMSGLPAPAYVDAAPAIDTSVFAFGNAPSIITVPPRAWIMNRLLLQRYVTVLTAAGSGGKSTLILTVAAHLALGKDFLGFKCVKPGKSIIYNAEDDMDEMARRLSAICEQYGFDIEQVKSKVCLIPGDVMELQLTTGTPPSLNVAHVQPLVQALADPEVVLFAIDPLVEVSSADENDNVQMKYIMSILRQIARKAEVAVLVAHHTKKPSGGSTGSAAGTAEAARGASSIINSARVALTLFSATEKDCERYGINEQDRHLYVRLDDAKMNLTLQSGEPVWLRKYGVRLFNGDEVGVLLPHNMQEDAAGTARVFARILYTEMQGRGLSNCGLNEGATILQAGDALLSQLPIKTVRSRLERALAKPVTLEDGRRIRIHRETKAGRNTVDLVID